MPEAKSEERYSMSSKRNLRKKQCTGKRRYGNRTDAQVQANYSWKQGNKLKVYVCPHCKGFHLAHVGRTPRALRYAK